MFFLIYGQVYNSYWNKLSYTRDLHHFFAIWLHSGELEISHVKDFAVAKSKRISYIGVWISIPVDLWGDNEITGTIHRCLCSAVDQKHGKDIKLYTIYHWIHHSATAFFMLETSNVLANTNQDHSSCKKSGKLVDSGKMLLGYKEALFMHSEHQACHVCPFASW